MDFIHHWKGDPSELSLRDSSSVTLISCFTKSIQPISPGSKEKMSWYSTIRVQAAAWFPSDHPFKPDRSSCWKRVSFLHSTDILICWLTWILSSLSRVLGINFTGGTTFVSTTWVTLMPLVMVIGTVIRFFTTTARHLLPVVTLVYVFTTHSPQGKWGSLPPLSLSHYMHATSQEQGFHLAMYYLGQKSIYLSSLCCLDCLIQIGGITCWRSSSIAFDRKLSSMIWQQPGYPQSIQRSWQLIYLAFLDHINDPIDGRGTQNYQYSGPKGGRI